MGANIYQKDRTKFASLGDTADSVQITDPGWYEVVNDGTSNCYLEVADSQAVAEAVTATGATIGHIVLAGSSATVYLSRLQWLGLICATGQTTDVYVQGV